MAKVERKCGHLFKALLIEIRKIQFQEDVKCTMCHIQQKWKSSDVTEWHLYWFFPSLYEMIPMRNCSVNQYIKTEVVYSLHPEPWLNLKWQGCLLPWRLQHQGVITSSILELPSWRRHQMETFSALLALCEGKPPVIGGFPSQRPVTWNFDVFFDLRLNKRLSKQLRRRWFETQSRSLWL